MPTTEAPGVGGPAAPAIGPFFSGTPGTWDEVKGLTSGEGSARSDYINYGNVASTVIAIRATDADDRAAGGGGGGTYRKGRIDGAPRVVKPATGTRPVAGPTIPVAQPHSLYNMVIDGAI